MTGPSAGDELLRYLTSDPAEFAETLTADTGEYVRHVELQFTPATVPADSAYVRSLAAELLTGTTADGARFSGFGDPAACRGACGDAAASAAALLRHRVHRAALVQGIGTANPRVNVHYGTLVQARPGERPVVLDFTLRQLVRGADFPYVGSTDDWYRLLNPAAA